MQSKTNTMLYNKLTTITSDIASALDNNDFQLIAELSENHNDIMNDIRQTVTDLDIQMKPAIEQAEKQVQSVMIKIQKMQSEIADQLSAMNKKRLIKTAYATK